MKKIIMQIIVVLNLFYCPNLFALTSTCGVGDPGVGYNTIYHRASWSYSDYVYVSGVINPILPQYYLISGLTSGGILQTPATDTYGADTKVQYLENPADGTYSFYGNSYLGYLDLNNIFAYAMTNSCTRTGYVTNTPTVFVTISPSPTVAVGANVVITVAATNTNSCSYNGGIPISLGSYSFTANSTNAGTYKVTCVGPLGGMGTGSATLTVTPPSVTITTATGVIGAISNSLSMPSVTFQASTNLSSVPASSITYKWYMEMRYNEHGKNFIHRIPSSGTISVTGSNSWSPNFAGLLAGANDISVYVTATVEGLTSSVASKSGFQIVGTNPTKAQIFSIATTLESKAVAWQESTHRQFAGIQYSGTGLPLWGTPDGWGLMQIDPLASEAQLWNWQNSLTLGVNYLSTVKSDAQAYLNNWYNVALSSPDPGDNWAWNPQTQNSDWVWDDGFSRYNTGSSIFSPNGNGGVRNCTLNSFGCNYASLVRGHMNSQPW